MSDADVRMRLEKLAQVPGILDELELDAWLTFVRETESVPDPSLDVLLGGNVTWQSVFFLSRDGSRTALVGSLDETRVRRSGLYEDVRGYVGGISESLMELLRKKDPKRIAINFSRSSELADGLTHGMFLLLLDILRDSPYADRLESSEKLVAALRGRKTGEEVSRIRRACEVTLEIYRSLTARMSVGMTERDVATMITADMNSRGLEPAWEPIQCPAVFTGPDSAGAHAGPTDQQIRPGHILNVDFGVRVDGYCSDLQRTWYFPRSEDRDAIPDAVRRGFQTIRDAVHKAADAIRPGKKGWEIDAVARSYIVDAGYEEYPHALGHQVGRAAHDGGGLLCPHWERYADRGDQPIEVGQVYTIEPRLTVEGHGIATIEEIVWVRQDGVEFLSDPQMELWVVKP